MRRLLPRLAAAAAAAAALLLLAGLAAAQPADGDGDGVPDDLDLCPAESASPFDADGDGCLDATANARRVEFWDPADLPLRYVVHSEGAPGITGGSDFAAIQAGYAAWTVLPGVQLSASYEGTTTDPVTSGLDGINQVSFKDPEFLAIYGNAVLAVGVTTSFDVPTEFAGRTVRPGQIVDADMLFNPNRTFRTTDSGPGIDLESVAVHEAGHLFGFSHSCVVSSTMFPALPGGNAARSLETEDRVLAFMAYPDPTLLPGATWLEGSVTNGDGGDPIGGAAVFAIATATGDTLGCQYTLADGGYRFVGLPAGDYYVTVQPLDGSVASNGVVPGLVNHLVDAAAVTLFLPEAWDLAESATDDGQARDPVTLVAGTPVTGIDIVTNVDAAGPVLLQALPQDGAASVRADAVFVLQFDEAIDFDTAQQNFHFDRVSGDTRTGLGGNLLLISEGKRLVFDPTGLLEYGAGYELTLGAAVADLFGNLLGGDVVLAFTVEPPPPLAIDSVSPRYLTPGSVAVVSGRSFDLSDPAANLVDFGGTVVPAQSVTATAVVATVPENVPLQAFSVTVTTPGGGTSNAIPATGISGIATPRGTAFDGVDVGAGLRALAMLPDGVFAYAATGAGLACMVSDPGVDGFLDPIPVPLSGGAVDVTVTPDGTRAYAVSRTARSLVVVNADYGDPVSRNPAFNTVLAELGTVDEPLGLAVAPDGRRVFVATAAATVQAWDVVPGSATYNEIVGEIELPATPAGRLALDPSGSRLYVPTAAGTLLAFDAATLAPTAEASVGGDPRDIAVDPRGSPLYVTLGNGDMAVVEPQLLATLATVPIGGTPRGLALSPAGGYGYVANRAGDRLEVVDLDGASPAYLSVAATFPTGNDPVDAAVSPDGLLVFAAEEGSGRISVLGVGYGPIAEGIAPRYGRPGDLVVIRGAFMPADTSLVITVGGVWVDFDDIRVPLSLGPEPYSSTGSQLWVRVPDDYDGGPIQVVESGPAVTGMPSLFFSNPLRFGLLDEPYDAVNPSVFLGPSGGYDWAGSGMQPVLATSPAGDLLAAADLSGTIHVLDFDPGSPTYGEELFASPLTGIALAVADLAFSPDGRRLFVSASGGPVALLDSDPGSAGFGAFLGTVDFSGLGGEAFGAGLLAMHPSGELLIVQNAVNDGLVFVNADPDGVNYLEVTASTGPLGYANDLAIHPSGKYAYFTATTGQVHIVNLDPFSPAYLTQVSTYTPRADEIPRTVAFSPDGRRAYVVTRGFGAVGDHVLEALDTTVPSVPAHIGLVTLAASSPPDDCTLRVSPVGQRGLCDLASVGVLYLDLGDAAVLAQSVLLSTVYPGPESRAIAFSAKGDRIFSAAAGDSGIAVAEFYGAPKGVGISGESQVGVAGQPLPAPVRIRMNDSTTGLPLLNATAEISVAGGGGHLGNGAAHQLMTTDGNGEIAIDWTLGPDVDPDPQTPLNHLLVTFFDRFTVIDGITAHAVADPNTLPLSLSQVLPVDDAADVSATTTVQATFSRAVDRATVGPATLALRRDSDGLPVASVYGYADGDRRVSLIPLAALDPLTTYELLAGEGLAAVGGAPLLAPDSTTFTTQAPPPLGISAISPPAATVGSEVIISGRGFPPGGSVISFNGAAGVLQASQPGYLRVIVPIDATSGGVTVQAVGQTAGPLPFTVLVPTDNPLNEILATSPTGVSIRSVAVLPDGSRAYTVSTETDQVLPLDLETLTALPAIAVGDQPLAAVSHPDGSAVYVVNFGSGSVWVIDTASDAVTAKIPVGNGPVDLVAAPAGDKLYVVNQSDQTLAVIDIESSHATYHTVVATTPTGSTTRGVAISPDGTRLYLGAPDGFLVVSLDPADFGVVATIPTGSTTRGVAISPDGTLLVLVTAGGDLLVVDVSPDGGDAVVATVPAGSSAKGVAISPDGTLLYVLLEDSDDILVFSLQVTGPVGVLASSADALPLTIVISLVDTISAVDDPELLVFDPTGSGLALVVSGGEGGVTFLNSSNIPYNVVVAEMLMEPRTLNLANNGTRVKATVTFPDDVSPHDVDVASVLLQDAIPADPEHSGVEDEDGDGVEDLVLMFDRAAFQEVLPQGDRVPVWLTGRLLAPDRAFTAEDTIRTLRPTVLRPEADEVLIGGNETVVSWLTPDNLNAGAVAVHFSPDAGRTWAPIALGIPDEGATAWTVPAVAGDSCRVMVVLLDSRGEELASGLSDAFAMRETATAVAPPTESALDQNYPNAFNPTTTIRFAIAREGRTRLTVYDVAGRRVRRLVDAVLKPGVYTAAWNGRDDRGGEVASGVYLYRLEAEGYVASRKMLLVR